MWQAAADAWDREYDWYEGNVRPFTSWFCDVAGATGNAVLDVASGTGQPALALAERIGQEGRLVATDVAPRMLTALARRAQAAGLTNVSCEDMAAEELHFESGEFDAVTCAFGLLYCNDPRLALSKMRRTLRPRGRCAVTVWAEPRLSPFFSVPGRALSEVLPPPLDPDAPQSWPLASDGELEAALRGAGFVDVEATAREAWFEVDSIDEYWRVFTALAPGVADQLAQLPLEETLRARTSLAAAAAPFEAAGRLRLKATALAAVATTP